MGVGGKGGSSPFDERDDRKDTAVDDTDEDPVFLRVEPEEPSEPVRGVPSFSQVKGGPDTAMGFCVRPIVPGRLT